MFAVLIAAGLGSVQFEATGSPGCKKAVLRGVLELHSFMYGEAHEAFQGAGKDCPIARWGEAMTYDHPIWGEEDLPKARAALEAIGDTSRLSPLEKGLIEAARALFAGSDWKQRHLAWLDKLARLHAQLPDDDEAAAFHALALIAVSDDGKDVRRSME